MDWSVRGIVQKPNGFGLWVDATSYGVVSAEIGGDVVDEGDFETTAEI